MKAEYFREVEEAFLTLTGRGVAISEKDRFQIESWFAAGVPVAIVKQVMSDAKSPSQNRKIRSLGYLSKAVDQAFSARRERLVGKAHSESSASESVTEKPSSSWTKIVVQRLSSQMELFRDDQIGQAFLNRLSEFAHDSIPGGLVDDEEVIFCDLWQSLSQMVQDEIQKETHRRVETQDYLCENELNEAKGFLRRKIMRQRLNLPDMLSHSGKGWA